MSITVLTQPMCGPCTQVKKFLTNRGIEFEERDVTADEEARNLLLSLGHTGTPVVIAGDDHWKGIDLAKMRELAAA